MPDPKRYDQFSELVRRHTSQILAYLDTLLLNRTDAEDLFQETCIVLWQKFDEYGPTSNFLAWALRIADYKVMNFQQKRARQTLFADNLRNALMAEVASRTTEASAACLAALSGCMERLAQNDRHIMTLCYAQGEPVSRIADALGRSPQSVHNSLHRIRNWLLDCIHRELNRSEMPAPTRHDPILGKEDRT
jgi:RNA polymerase sigma-70 factor, ECF subfamily